MKTTSVNSQNLVGEMYVSYKLKSNVKLSELPTIKTSNDTYEYLKSVWNLDTINYSEDMMMLLLSRSLKVLGWVRISSGGFDGTMCDPKVVFSIALTGKASSIILAHNHPSGNLQPSQADINIMKKIAECGRLLDIKLLDHIIITSEGYLSFADDGLM